MDGCFGLIRPRERVKFQINQSQVQNQEKPFTAKMTHKHAEELKMYNCYAHLRISKSL